MDADAELAFWRELANRRGRELELLRGRILALLAEHPELDVQPFASTLDAPGAWVNDVDRIPHSPDLLTTDILSAMDELWKRVSADR